MIRFTIIADRQGQGWFNFAFRPAVIGHFTQTEPGRDYCFKWVIYLILAASYAIGYQSLTYLYKME